MSRLATGTLAILAGGAATLWLKARRDQPPLEARTRARLAPREKEARP